MVISYAPPTRGSTRATVLLDGAGPHPLRERLGVEPGVEQVFGRGGDRAADDDGGGCHVSRRRHSFAFPFLVGDERSRAARRPSQKRRYFSIHAWASASGAALSEST